MRGRRGRRREGGLLDCRSRRGLFPRGWNYLAVTGGQCSEDCSRDQGNDNPQSLLGALVFRANYTRARVADRANHRAVREFAAPYVTQGFVRSAPGPKALAPPSTPAPSRDASSDDGASGLAVRDIAREPVAGKVEHFKLGEPVHFQRDRSRESVIGQIHHPQLGDRVQPRGNRAGQLIGRQD